jgi:DNA invertase Pin-like site-specific DNA recombinase
MSGLTPVGQRNGHATPVRVTRPLRVGLYARVSTTDQTPENQLAVLRAFAEARGWAVTEYTDHGISGARTSRPALDALMAAARARRLDVVLTTKLDRLARSTRHLVDLAAELEALGVDLVVTDQNVDTTTPAGKLLFHVLAAIAEFERDLIRERVIAGIRRARAQGRHVGRPPKYQVDPATVRELLVGGVSLRAAARRLGVHPSAVSRALARVADPTPECPGIGSPLNRATE